MKKVYYLSLLLFALFCSCKPDPPLVTKLNQGIVDGTVRDATTLEPIPFATVILFHGRSDGSLFGCCPTSPIAETIADSTGAFHFDFEFEPGYFYTCNGVAELYFQPTLETDVDYFVTEGYNVEVFLDPKAYLQIHYANIPPSSPSDILGVNGYVTDVLYGLIDSNIIYAVNGNFWNEIYWAEGYNPTNADTIYCPAFDTSYFEIFY